MMASHILESYNDIKKSQIDKRDYRGLLLSNHMRVLLISDPTTDKSSASMDINVGFMCDPKNIPGLAHFCEHMLFLGTEKYPLENEYNKFLSQNGGSSNAYTQAEHTNYYFDIAPEELHGALDRFAQFFLSPLFTDSATEREVNAVNSENDKNIQNDNWRLLQLDKSTSRPDHDYCRFGTGNKETLDTIPKKNGLNTRDELLNFHNKYYSSNIMSFCILGKESLDELQEMVVPLLKDVKNKEINIPEWNESPYGPEQLKKQAYVVPVKDLRSMSVTWPIPDLHPHYKSSPGQFLGHLIGHEGKGSLLSELKSRGWVNQLVGGIKAGAKGFSFFVVNVDLSEEGIEHTDDIVTLMFQYIKMLKSSEPQEWVFQETKDLCTMQFHFKDKEKPRSYTCQCSGLMMDYPMNEVLSGCYLLEEFRPDLIKMVLDLLTPENMRVAVVGMKYKEMADKTEEWYNTQYSIEDISEEFLQKLSSTKLNECLTLPPRNEFIPSKFDLIKLDEEVESTPVIIHSSEMTRLWYKQDNTFLLPKACVNIELKSPYAYLDPINSDLNYMFVSLFRDALNEYAYDAELAGLNYSLNNTTYGLTLSAKGYNDKLFLLLQKVMEKMTSFEIDPQRFEVLKENYIRGLKNFRAEQPHQHAIYYTAVLTSETMWTKEELLDATEEVTIDRLKQFIPQLLSYVYLEILCFGNLSRKETMDVGEMVENTLRANSKSKPLLLSQRKQIREVKLPDGCSFVYKKNNEVHNSSSLEMYYQTGEQDTESNMILELFCQIISEPCFDQLRTKEQLGYIVFSGIRRSSGVQGLRIIVQSDKDPIYVENRIEIFLQNVKNDLETMSDEEFQKHMNALATKRLEQPKKLTSQNAKYWSEIVSQHYNFNRDNLEVEFLKKLTKENVINFYNEIIAHNAPKRHKLCVLVFPCNPSTEASPINNESDVDGILIMNEKDKCEIQEVTSFKSSLALYPLPKPFVDLTTMTKSKL